MSEVETKETREVKGEWGGRLEEWRAKDKNLLRQFSEVVLAEEVKLSLAEHDEARQKRQLNASLEVIKVIIGEPTREEYFPGPKVIERTARQFEREEAREAIKAALGKRGEEFPDEFLDQLPGAVESAILPAKKRRYYAEFQRAMEEGDKETALITGVMALLAGKVPEKELSEFYIEATGLKKFVAPKETEV